MGKMRTACKSSVRKPERKSPVGRIMRREEDNIKTDLREIGCGDVN
jgi:hypothetical protein